MSAKEMYDFSILRALRRKEGLSIQDVSDASGVSVSVISKLERNRTSAELETVYKLAQVFGMNPSDLLSLAESQIAHRKRAGRRRTGGFSFSEINYGNIRCLHGNAKAGSSVSRPKIHKDDYELCWVLKGKLLFHLPNEKLNLLKGESIQFDALLEHTYEAVEDCEIIILHIKKPNRF